MYCWGPGPNYHATPQRLAVAELSGHSQSPGQPLQPEPGAAATARARGSRYSQSPRQRLDWASWRMASAEGAPLYC
jgi:hypothetical protein